MAAPVTAQEPGKGRSWAKPATALLDRLIDLLARALPSASIRWLLGCGMLAVAAILIATTVMVFKFRDRAMANNERELQNAALMLAWHIDQEFGQLELVEERIVDAIRARGITSRAAFEQQVSNLDANRLLRAEIDGLPHVRGLRVISATGELLNGTRGWPVGKISDTDLDFVPELEASPDTEVGLSKPWRDPANGEWLLGMAQRVTSSKGEVLGFVIGTIQLSHLEDYFELIALGPSSSIGLTRSDGVLLVRYPHIESKIGETFGRVRSMMKDEQQRMVHGVSRVDGQDRLLAFRRVPHFPLEIVVGVQTAAALQDWHDQTRTLVIAGAGCSLVLLGIILLIIRQLSIEHALARRRLALGKQRLDVAVNNMTQGLLVFDSRERLVVYNRPYLEMFGLSDKVVRPGCTFRELMQHRKDLGTFSGDVDEFCSAYTIQNRSGEVTRSLANTTDGRSIQIVNQPLPDGGWVATLEDVTEQKRAAEKIAYLAHYDSLTDLPNRALFRDKLETMLGNLGEGESLAVLYLDLDQFKDINDTLGHPAGDELLNIVAGRLRGGAKAADVVARLGGDEFAVIQTNVRRTADVIAMAQRIAEVIRAPMVIEGHTLTVDTSIGIAVAPHDGLEPDQLLKHADLALYQVKADGRGTYRFFEAEMDFRAKARRSLEVDLRQAIERGELEVHYQPQVNLADGRLAGLEALVRWRHPQRGMIPPIDFIPIAEDSGLINPIGEWVLKTACAEAAGWPGDLKVGVNVSPVQLRNASVSLIVASALAASGLPPRRLELEVTEAVLIRDDKTALAILRQLQKLGVRIALDDFGTGYSSLSYLQRFPFDKIKIDRSFINDITNTESSLPIVQAIVSIAQARNMTTTAEGVETAEQLEMLKTSGCVEMQGYLVCRPKPAAELRDLLASVRRNLFAA